MLEPLRTAAGHIANGTLVVTIALCSFLEMARGPLGGSVDGYLSFAGGYYGREVDRVPCRPGVSETVCHLVVQLKKLVKAESHLRSGLVP